MKNIVKKAVVAIAAVGMLALPGLQAAMADTIKIGAILAVTGPSFLGVPEANTLKMLTDELNARGGLNGNKVELIIKDSGGVPEKAISFAKQLIEEEKVFAIIGPSTSGATMKIKNIAEQSETLLLSCAAAEVIVNPVAKWVFKTPQMDSDAVRKIYMEMNKMNISKIAVVVGNTGFGQAGKGQLLEIAPEYGIDVVISEVYDKAATDLSAVVAKLMANKDIQAVVNWSIVPAQSIIIKNIRQAGWDVPIFQSHGFGNIKFVQAAGDAAEGVIFPAGRLLVADVLPEDNPQKEVLVKYKNDYESKFKEDASTFGGHAYDAFKILCRAIEQVGVDKHKVREAIENMKGFVGTGGVFNFTPENHNGLGLDAFEMMTVKDGKFTLYQK
ncbi:MAG: ABC transporter substrate-binding protein [Desulfobulbaceae bacterium]|nr:ABC transporter substrate-binding protein [Desulfobulbaceae bacterium]